MIQDLTWWHDYWIVAIPEVILIFITVVLGFKIVKETIARDR